MKIAILGANGFVGQNLAHYLKRNHSVVKVTRSTVDLLDYNQVYEYLLDQSFDVVVNAAAVMTNDQSLNDIRNNLGLFMNFYHLSHCFSKFINLGSGAEFDRSMDIDQASGSLIFDRMPKDSYGLGQNFKSRLCWSKPNFYTLRIFNCFGPGELSTRIFAKTLHSDGPITVTGDRFFDYFSIQDLCKVVEHYVTEEDLPKDINCVYQDKHKISQVISKFNSIHNLKKQVIIQGANALNYTGDGTVLASLELPLKGLTQGLIDYVSN